MFFPLGHTVYDEYLTPRVFFFVSPKQMTEYHGKLNYLLLKPIREW